MSNYIQWALALKNAFGVLEIFLVFNIPYMGTIVGGSPVSFEKVFTGFM